MLCGILWIYLYLCLYEPISVLQVRPKSAEPERQQGLENQPGKVRQKRKIEHNRTLCEIVRKSMANFDGWLITKSPYVQNIGGYKNF